MKTITAEFARDFADYNNAAAHDPSKLPEFMEFVEHNFETIVNGQPQFIMFILPHFDLTEEMDEKYVDLITRFIDAMPSYQEMADLDFQTIVLITYFIQNYMKGE